MGLLGELVVELREVGQETPLVKTGTVLHILDVEQSWNVKLVLSNPERQSTIPETRFFIEYTPSTKHSI